MNGISSVTDSPRPGHAHRVVTPEAIAAVEATVKENRRVTLNEIAAHLDMSNGSVHHNIRDIYLYIFKVFILLTLVKRPDREAGNTIPSSGKNEIEWSCTFTLSSIFLIYFALIYLIFYFTLLL